VPVFVLATAPRNGLHEAAFATSLQVP
jgi:hypothetical protein